MKQSLKKFSIIQNIFQMSSKNPRPSFSNSCEKKNQNKNPKKTFKKLTELLD